MATVDTPTHLSSIQKEVLAKIIAAPTPSLAWEAVTANVASDVERNFTAARKVLEDLGLISRNDEYELEVTETGKQAMKDAYLIDDREQLTNVGQQLATKNTQANESFTLIREVNQNISCVEFLKKN